MSDQGRRLRAGLLDPVRSRERVEVGRVSAPAALATCVDYFWWVSWHAPDGHAQEMIPRPTVHLVAEPVDGVARLQITGIQRRRFDRLLEGDGRAVAVAFRPAGFRPFFGRSVGELRDREVDAATVWLDLDPGLAGRLLDPARSLDDAAAELGTWLAARPHADDPHVGELAALVERIETDSTITRAEQVAELAGVGLRTLQRRFVEYVGIGPKWVVQRFRLLDVGSAAHGADPVDWAALAVELGYSDQSHLIRSFTALVGRPPATYFAELARSRTS